MQLPVFLTISDLWIERDERDLCKELAFDLHAGDILRILGENGAGKSSLLKVILGVLPTVRGNLVFQGQDVTKDRFVLQKDTVYIGHSVGVKKALTVKENLHRYYPNASQDELYFALEQLDLLPFMDSFSNTLSAGQIKRVALAKLWLGKETLWLLDEPFSALDAHGTNVVEERIQHHTSCGGAVILTTHQNLLTLNPRNIQLTS